MSAERSPAALLSALLTAPAVAAVFHGHFLRFVDVPPPPSQPTSLSPKAARMLFQELLTLSQLDAEESTADLLVRFVWQRIGDVPGIPEPTLLEITSAKPTGRLTSRLAWRVPDRTSSGRPQSPRRALFLSSRSGTISPSSSNPPITSLTVPKSREGDRRRSRSLVEGLPASRSAPIVSPISANSIARSKKEEEHQRNHLRSIFSTHKDSTVIEKSTLAVAVELIALSAPVAASLSESFASARLIHQKPKNEKGAKHKVITELKTPRIQNAESANWEACALHQRVLLCYVDAESRLRLEVEIESSSARETLSLEWTFKSVSAMRRFRSPSEIVTLPLAHAQGQFAGSSISVRLFIGNKEVRLALEKLESCTKSKLPPPSISTVFASMTGLLRSTLTARDFATFIRKFQQEPINDLDALVLIRELEKSDSTSELSRHGFERFLKSAYNDILDPVERTVNHAMDRPLCEYFISTSHNTYLMGHQITGSSTLEGYVYSLQRGCRCIEIDVLSSGSHGLIVKHMHCPTGFLELSEVLKTIRKHAFEASPYPLILSIEINCTKDGQRVLAVLLQEELGRFIPPLFDHNSLPFTPNNLKNKILVKAGPLKQLVDEMIALTHIPIIDHVKWDFMEENTRPWFVSNLPENQALAYNSVTSDKKRFISLNTKQLTRVYPKGTRVDSSNFNPMPFFHCGAQLVAMNYQTTSPAMWKYDGWFEVNGRSGYALKPPVLLSSYYDATSRRVMTIKVISGWNLPDLVSSPAYAVRLEVNDCCGNVSAQTDTCRYVGHYVSWESEFSFVVDGPELSTLLVVLQTGSTRLAYYSAPVVSLRSGYRRVPLKDKTGMRLPRSALLVYTSLRADDGTSNHSTHTQVKDDDE